ncbi:MAG: S8 family serine peptidase [Cellulomonas sp.]|nr:S8 family serine peptidase [Cellulomonas sp.]
MLRTPALALVLWLVVAAPAAAADDDGLWWPDALDVARLTAAGATGEGVQVAVVDGGISPDLPLLADADLTVLAPSTCLDVDGDVTAPGVGPQLSVATFHGTNVTAMIDGAGVDGAVAGIAPDARVSFYATADDDGTPCVRDLDGGDIGFAQAIVDAVDDGARIVSLSIGTLDGPTREALAWALHEGVVVVAAVGNFEGDDDTLPMVNGLVAVQAEDSDLQPEGTGTPDGPVGHDHVTVVAPGVDVRLQGNLATGSWDDEVVTTGTSFAAPLVAGMLADLAQRYPAATPNQLIQDLVATAVPYGDGADPQVVGYGRADPVAMLQVDPTTYPDVNPLITTDPQTDGDLSAEEIAQATRPDLPDVGWTVDDTRSSEDVTAADGGDSATPAAVEDQTSPSVAIAATIAVLGAFIAAGLVARRRRRRARRHIAPGDPGPGPRPSHAAHR